MSYRFSGAALVTGAASGIGRATALAFADHGVPVAMLDRNEAQLAEAAEQVRAAGAATAPIVIDLLELKALPAAFTQAAGQVGDINYLVNCAAMVEGWDFGTPLTVTMDVFDAVHTVNLRAPLALMQLVAQDLIRRGSPGKFVNVTSSSAFRAQFSKTAYASAKAALAQVSRIMASELAPHDINVNCVAPGLTRTAGTAYMDYDKMLESGPLSNFFHRISEPEDVADAILFLCSDRSRQITAQTIHTSAGQVLS